MENNAFAYLLFCCRDLDRAKAISECMSNEKIRIAIDDSSAAMNVELSDKLNKCEACIVFVSRNALCSHHFRSTLTAAIEMNKSIITVYLEKAELTLCQKMQLARTDIIYATEGISANEIVKAIMSEGILDNCREITESASVYALTRASNGERIIIDAEEFSIGRSEVMTNHSVAGNSAISRLHAVFKRTQNGMTIIDQNSSNKTYINGKELTPMVEYALKSGDEVALANEKFVFEISK